MDDTDNYPWCPLLCLVGVDSLLDFYIGNFGSTTDYFDRFRRECAGVTFDNSAVPYMSQSAFRSVERCSAVRELHEVDMRIEGLGIYIIFENNNVRVVNDIGWRDIWDI